MGGGVSFGNIGTGYPYAFPSSQITWRSPEMGGLNIAVGILDPYDTNEVGAPGKAYQDTPRVESEISYQADISGIDIYTWVNGAYQKSENTDSSVADITSEGVGYGVQLKVADLTLTASGFDATGIHPLFTNNAGQAPLQEVDSNGYLIQAGYQIGKARIAGTYGRTEDDGVTGGSAIDYDNKGLILSYAANDYFNLVANFSRVELDDETIGEIETTDTLALGATVAW